MPVLTILLTSLLLVNSIVSAETIRVATASNFSETIKVIAHQFEQESGHTVMIISGSSGKHYAQIKNGAPFDAFFSADSQRAERLDRENIAVPGSRFTYAIGKVVLWSPEDNYIVQQADILTQGKFRYLAIANPKLAPYGLAAQQVLKKAGIWNKLRSRMVRGENIGQTFQFVKSRNAELGFIALSQIKRPNQTIEGSYWAVPQSLYTPILQQAVLLKKSDAGQLFLDFMKTQKVQQIIHNSGYDVVKHDIEKGANHAQ